ncbi:hypothetical protein EV646_11374 [Kribbella antiqua]|uniref:DUF4386 family protein n=1 Tax=Kribbella antiqua TaxID=2512217 RepID=A0A4R2IE56_9ACTN|nr:hypothetical protein [Kribbella antiqua]TCO42452.1 hypothetical protein EV646_11374 [Kribbella antiqua]
MVQFSTTPRSKQEADATASYRRFAGGFALGHVVLMLAAFSFEGVAAAEHGIAPSRLVDIYGGASVGRALGAGYVEALSFLVLMPAIVLVAWLFSQRTTGGRLAAQTFAALGIGYVASTLAVGFAPGAAALYAAHHGGDPSAIAIVSDIRNFGHVLQVAMSAAMALAIGIAALLQRLHTRWIGWGGVAVGGVGLLATPLAHNAVSMLWLVWWIGLAVVLLRRNIPRV